MKDSICFTGNNTVEVSAFISPTYFEFTGDTFVLPAPDVSLVLRKGDTLVKEEDGSFTIQYAQEIWPEPEPKKARGKKK